MSIFPPSSKDLIEKGPFNLPKPFGNRDTVNLFEKLKGKEYLSFPEASSLQIFYSTCLCGKGLVALIPTLIERGVIVTVSDEKKKYNGEEWANPYYPHKEGAPIILGQYSSGDAYDEIFLYIRNIRAAAKDFKGACKDEFWDLSPRKNCKVDSVDLLLSVFAHELYHAYFHKDKCIKNAEEPLAEFGSLLYMNQYFVGMENAEKKILGLYRMIRQKEENEAIKVYSLGAKLFLKAGSEVFDSDGKILGLIEEYKRADNNSLRSCAASIKNA